MAHMALLDSTNTVIAVHVASDIYDGREHALCEKTGKTYRQTSFNTLKGEHVSGDPSKAFRKNFAGKGYTYDPDRDAFIPPKPYPSWVLNEDTCIWECPVPMPSDSNTKLYVWDEATKSHKYVRDLD